MGSEEQLDKVKIGAVIGLLLFAGGTELAYIWNQGVDDDLVQQIVSDFHVVILMAVGGAIAVIGLGRRATGASPPVTSKSGTGTDTS